MKLNISFGAIGKIFKKFFIGFFMLKDLNFLRIYIKRKLKGLLFSKILLNNVLTPFIMLSFQLISSNKIITCLFLWGSNLLNQKS